MASTHIELTGNETRLAGQFRSFVDSLQSLRGQSAKIKSVMDSAANGSDWVGLRAAFGFASDADAESAYNIMTSVNTAIQGSSAVTEIVSKIG